MPPLHLTKEWLQTYVDDFDQIEVVEQYISHKLLNTETELMQAVQESYEASHLEYNPAKMNHMLYRLERLGACVDGEVGYLTTTASRRLKIVSLWRRLYY